MPFVMPYSPWDKCVDGWALPLARYKLPHFYFATIVVLELIQKLTDGGNSPKSRIALYAYC